MCLLAIIRMNTVEINKILARVPFFGGTYPRDSIPQTKTRPIAFVVNTDSKKFEGEHWLGILLLPDGTGEYFDPFGFPPLHTQLNNYMTINCTRGFQYNSRTIQNPISSSCGLFVIDFIVSRYKRDTFKQFLNHYSTDVEENEYVLTNRLEKWLRL